MLYVPTLSISKAPVAPKAFRSVAASAAGAIAAAGCSIVIAGLRILTVGAEAEDAGHALKQCIKFVFGVIVAEHVLVLHDLLVHGTELLIEALKGLIVAVLFLGLEMAIRFRLNSPMASCRAASSSLAWRAATMAM